MVIENIAELSNNHITKNANCILIILYIYCISNISFGEFKIHVYWLVKSDSA